MTIDMVLSKTTWKRRAEGGYSSCLVASLRPPVDSQSTLVTLNSRVRRPPSSAVCASTTTVSASTAGLSPSVIGMLPGPTGNYRGNDLYRPMWSFWRRTIVNVGVRHLVQWRNDDDDDRGQSDINLGDWATPSRCNNVFLLWSKWVKDVVCHDIFELLQITPMVIFHIISFGQG